MRKICIFIYFAGILANASAQLPRTELFDLLKKLSYDSTGYENVGDWNFGSSKKDPITWHSDNIEMSDDTSINFFRTGNLDIAINGKTYFQKGQPIKWTIMLKGPRMGYTSYSIITSPAESIAPGIILDSLFTKKIYKARLLKGCHQNAISGFNYYEVKFPKKDVVFIKLSWLTLNGNTALRIDGYDTWSKNRVKLACPN